MLCKEDGSLRNPKLTKFWVKNFKSLKDVEIEFGNFNLLVGPNASGKTNIIEAFKLFEKIHSYSPYINPFLEWWGYQNVVWHGVEELPITMGIEIQVSDYKARYEASVTGLGGKFEILRESVDIPNFVKIDREGNKVTVKHEPEFINKSWEKVKSVTGPIPVEFEAPKILKKNQLLTQQAEIDVSEIKPLCSFGWSASYSHEFALVTLHMPYIKGDPLRVVSPVIETPRRVRDRGGRIKEEFASEPLVNLIFGYRFMKPRILLRQLDFKAISSPQPVRREVVLSEDGSNLANVFHTIYTERDVPQRIQAILNAVFGDGKEIAVKPTLTDDGRVYIKVLEGDYPLNPPMVADGLWKLLAILIAIETKPFLLVIDELENSLHPRAIEYVVNELKNSGCIVIATTHSPAVVDIVKPEDLILVTKDEEGATRVRKVVEPEKVKQWLAEHGITLSESWLYGEL
jgi:predicted ATPase